MFADFWKDNGQAEASPEDMQPMELSRHWQRRSLLFFWRECDLVPEGLMAAEACPQGTSRSGMDLLGAA